jgi:hypothetical protein
MAFDDHKNFAYSLVTVAPSPAASGTSLTVRTGEGALYPAVPFNATVSAVGVLPVAASAEIVRVTARAGDVLTLVRAQESSSARQIVVGDQIVATITAKTLKDVEQAIPLTPAPTPRASLNRTAVQSVPNGAFTAIVWDAESFDVGNCHSLVTNPSRLTVPAGGDGVYVITATISYGSVSGTSVRGARLHKNGAFAMWVYQPSVPNDQTIIQIPAILSLVAGDYLEAIAYHNAGVAVNVDTNSSFAWVRVPSA